jgi:hypothetical protein
MFVIGELDWGAGVWAVALGIPGILLVAFAVWLGPRVQSKIGQVLLVYPVTALALLFLGAGALVIVANLLAPLILVLWVLVKPVWNMFAG